MKYRTCSNFFPKESYHWYLRYKANIGSLVILSIKCCILPTLTYNLYFCVVIYLHFYANLMLVLMNMNRLNDGKKYQILARNE